MEFDLITDNGNLLAVRYDDQLKNTTMETKETVSWVALNNTSHEY